VYLSTGNYSLLVTGWGVRSGSQGVGTTLLFHRKSHPIPEEKKIFDSGAQKKTVHTDSL